MKRLPVQHNIELTTEERKLPNGNSFYLPLAGMDATKTVELQQKDQDLFVEFMSWVQNYNEYIINVYAEKAGDKDGAELDELNLDDIIDIDEVA